MRAALAYNQYRIFAASGLLNFASFAMQNVVRAWLMLTLTDSPFLISLVLVAALAPLPLLAVFGGELADRLNRKVVVLIGDAAFIAVSAVLITITALDLVQPWHVIALTAANGVAFALSASSRQTMYSLTIPPRLIKPAAEFYALLFNIGGVIGPAITLFSLPLWGIVASMIIALSLKLVSVAVLAFIKLTPQPRRDAKATVRNLFDELREGVVYSFSVSNLRLLLLLLVVVGVSVGSYRAVLPVFTSDVLGGGDLLFSLLNFVTGAGAITGAVLVIVLDRRINFRRDSYSIGLLGCLAVAGFALATAVWAALALVFVIGILFAAFLSINVTNVAHQTPPEIRGRVTSVRFVLMGLTSAGALTLGLLAEALSTPAALIYMAAAGGGALALLFAIEHSRDALARLRREPDAGLGK